MLRNSTQLGPQQLRLQATALETAANSIVITDREGAVQWVNPAFVRLTGYALEEIRGQNRRLLKSGKHGPQLYRDLWNTILAGRTWRGEIIDRRKDGTLYTAEMTITPVRSNQAEITHFVVIEQDVTQRKQVEEALRGSNEFNQQILASADEGIAVYDRDLRCRLWNSYLWALTGLTQEQTQGKDVLELFSFLPEHEVKPLIERALAGEAVCSRDVPYHIPSTGRSGWMMARYSPLRDATGQISGVIGILRDITERKRVDHELEKREELLHTIVESAPDCIKLLDPDGAILQMNAAGLAMIEAASLEEVKGCCAATIVAPESQEAFRRLVEAVAGGESREMEFEIVGLKGTRRWLHTRAVPLRDNQGQVSAILGLTDDISQRKRTEGWLRQAEEKYRGIFEGATAGIFQISRQGRVLEANPAMARMLGYGSCAELMASVADALGQLVVDAASQQEIGRVLKERELLHNMECELYRKDGSKMWVLASVRIVRDPQGEVLRYEGMCEDITERKGLEEQLRQAQRMEAVGRLAGGVAHDFNNMLGVIIGYSDLLRGSLPPGDPRSRQVEEVKKAAGRAAALTRQLLAFSRKQVLQPKVLDLDAVVADLGKMLRRLIGEDIELAIVPNASPGRVKADPGQLEQVIMNLAINARDAMPQGGKLSIEITNVDLDETGVGSHALIPPGRYVMLAISDTGCGIDPQVIPHIFEPFFTTKELGKGTGLGLATVYGVVKQSEGYIRVSSELGKGTTFQIYLPRVEKAHVEAVAPQPQVALARGAETILLVEDEPPMRELARDLLENNGYAVLAAPDGASALRMAAHHAGPIHLLLTDVIMPGMSGVKLAQRLKGTHPGAKLLYISGYTDDRIAQHGLPEDAIALLEKPFTRESLLGKVREVLNTQDKETVKAQGRRPHRGRGNKHHTG